MALEAEHLVGGRGEHVGVAVPVTTNPRAESDRNPVRGDRLPDGGQSCLHLVEQVGYGLADGQSDVVED